MSFTGLSCYLIYSGLYSSAVTVSQAVSLRHSIRQSVTAQSKLLDSIGTAQMKQELEDNKETISLHKFNPASFRITTILDNVTRSRREEIWSFTSLGPLRSPLRWFERIGVVMRFM